jgi:transcriptional regulator with XRE-family HTH domain
MTSYTKWDRDAYIERVGGPEEAERRRKALMARQSGQRLAEERKQRGLTQAQLAETMGVTPGRVSQIERGELSTIEAIARYVQALGGRLDLVANFADHTLTVTTTGGRRCTWRTRCHYLEPGEAQRAGQQFQDRRLVVDHEQPCRIRPRRRSHRPTMRRQPCRTLSGRWKPTPALPRIR